MISLFSETDNQGERMGFKRPLVRFQSLGPKWGKPLKLLSFNGFFFCLFHPAALFNALEFYTKKGDSSALRKRLKTTAIEENFRIFLAAKRSSGVREITILSYMQAYSDCAPSFFNPLRD